MEEKYVNEVSGKIVAIKTEVHKQNWKTMMFECQQSGLPVKEWCRQNGINPSTYYTRLRKLREKVRCDMVRYFGITRLGLLLFFFLIFLKIRNEIKKID